MKNDLDTAQPWQKFLAEYLAATLFLYAVSASVVVPSLYTDASPIVITVVAALIQGLSLVAVTASFSWISGSHVNMAVTATALATRKITLALGAGYMVAQVLGSLTGAGLARASFPSWKEQHLSAVEVGPVRLYQAYVLETVLTLILLLVVLGTSTDARHGLYILAPIPIGFTLLVSVLISRTFTGASLSPNRALATAIVGERFDNHWIYWVAPITAVLLASAAYHAVFVVKRGKQKPEDIDRTSFELT